MGLVRVCPSRDQKSVEIPSDAYPMDASNPEPGLGTQRMDEREVRERLTVERPKATFECRRSHVESRASFGS